MRSNAGRRAVEAVEAGLDLGLVGARARMNLVRGYLLVDEPDQAGSVLRAGSPGDEIAALVLAPALAARIALRQGRLCEAERQATAALQAAHAFGLDTHGGAVEAHLALAGVLIDRNELADAIGAFRRLDEILLANPFARVYQVLLRLEKARVAAALDDFDDVFATLREAGKLIDAYSAIGLACIGRCGCRPLAPAGGRGTPGGGTDQPRFPRAARRTRSCGPDWTWPAAASTRSEPGSGGPALRRCATSCTGELLLARAAIESGEDPRRHVRVAVGLAVPERLVRVFLDEGPAVARLARAAAESLGTESGTNLAVALGSPPRSRGAPRQPAAILTDRELLVLRFLPSHLTYAEIARECLMSVNTVKTHLKRIYAKLGVSSRAATVERARLLGLL